MLLFFGFTNRYYYLQKSLQASIQKLETSTKVGMIVDRQKVLNTSARFKIISFMVWYLAKHSRDITILISLQLVSLLFYQSTVVPTLVENPLYASIYVCMYVCMYIPLALSFRCTYQHFPCNYNYVRLICL